MNLYFTSKWWLLHTDNSVNTTGGYAEEAGPKHSVAEGRTAVIIHFSPKGMSKKQ